MTGDLVALDFHLATRYSFGREVVITTIDFHRISDFVCELEESTVNLNVVLVGLRYDQIKRHSPFIVLEQLQGTGSVFTSEA